MGTAYTWSVRLIIVTLVLSLMPTSAFAAPKKAPQKSTKHAPAKSAFLAQKNIDGDYVPGEFIVKFKNIDTVNRLKAAKKSQKSGMRIQTQNVPIDTLLNKVNIDDATVLSSGKSSRSSSLGRFVKIHSEVLKKKVTPKIAAQDAQFKEKEKNNKRAKKTQTLPNRRILDADSKAMLKALNNDPLVEYAEPNYRVYAAAVPTDPRYGDQWGFKNTGQKVDGVATATSGADIDAEGAWSISTGSSDVIAAVVDTGVDYTHEDLANNIWTNSGEVGATATEGPQPNCTSRGISPIDKNCNNFDDDGDGYVDDWHGWNFNNNTNDPMDDYGHGTHVAGTIGAGANNAKGGVGLNWSVKIMALKFLDNTGGGEIADVIPAIAYATDHGAAVQNHSWGGATNSLSLFDVINESSSLVVFAAGNSANNNDANPSYPDSFEAPNILSVAASDQNDALASFSNYGQTTVDVAAPGTEILSTVPTGSCEICDPSGYAYLQGTSMASPHAAGLAALLKAHTPSLTNLQMKKIIMDTVDPIASLATKTVSGGRINALTALNATVPTFSIVKAYAMDLTGRGVIDALDIEFSVPINDATIASHLTNFSFDLDNVNGSGNEEVISSGSTNTLYPVSSGVNDKYYRLKVTAGIPTTAPIFLHYTGTGVLDMNANELVAGNNAAKVMLDRAGPVYVSAQYLDSSGSGAVDSVEVTMSESVLLTEWNDAEWAIANPEGSVLNLQNESDAQASGTKITLDVEGDPGITGSTVAPKISFTRGSSVRLKDAIGNAAASFSNKNISDGTAPVILSSQNEDTNSDGRIDRISLSLSQDLGTAYTFNGADWSYAERGTVNGSKTIGSVSANSSIAHVTVSGTTAYVGDGSTLRVFDISSPAAPSLLGSLSTNGTINGIAIVNGKAYIADNSSGLVIADVSNPVNVTQLGTFAINGYANSVVVSGSTAYVVDSFTGVNIIDVTNAALPVSLAVYSPASNSFASVAIRGTTMYALDNWNNLVSVADISSPSTPSELTTIAFDSPNDLFISGSTLYVADGASGLKVMDISNPAVPGTQYVSAQPAASIRVQGTTAFTLETGVGLHALDVATPASGITLLGTASLSGIFTDLSLGTNVVFVAADTALRSVDATDLTFTLSDAPISGGSLSNATTLRLTVQGIVNATGGPVAPALQYTQPNTNNALKDGANNKASSILTTITDAAYPLLLSATYRDANTDGTVDQIRTTWSEPVTIGRSTTADWTITPGTINTAFVSVADQGTAASTIDVTVSADALKVGGATSPTIRYVNTTGAVKDATPSYYLAAPTSASAITVTDGTAPNVPTTPTPANNTVSRDQAVVLAWIAPTSTDSSTTYDVQVDNDANFSSPTFTQNTAAVTTTTTALANGTYYWHVRSSDATGNKSAYTASSAFVVNTNTITNTPLGSTTVVTTPQVGSVAVSLRDAGTEVVNFQISATQAVSLATTQVTDTSGLTVVRGLTLPAGVTKTTTVSVPAGTNKICINDTDGANGVSASCTANGEVIITCPGTVGSYSCSMISSTRAAISGLSHSAIGTFSPAAVVILPPSGGGGGGSGGGGSSITPPAAILPPSTPPAQDSTTHSNQDLLAFLSGTAPHTNSDLLAFLSGQSSVVTQPVSAPVTPSQNISLPNFLDSDGDGLLDSAEALIGTNPRKADSDGDGYIDGEEITHGYSPLDKKAIKIVDLRKEVRATAAKSKAQLTEKDVWILNYLAAKGFARNATYRRQSDRLKFFAKYMPAHRNSPDWTAMSRSINLKAK